MVNLVDALAAPENLEEKPPVRGDRLDKAGATASFVCAIHCAIVPIVAAFLPLVGLEFLASRPVEWALVAASAVLGTFSLRLGYREHRSPKVFGVLAIALALLVAGRIFEEQHWGIWGPILMVAGGLSMTVAHFFNHLLCKACRVCDDHSCSA